MRSAFLLLVFLVIAVSPAGADLGDLRIAVVKPGASGGQWAELLNAGPQPLSLEGVWLASDAWVGPMHGLAAVPPGGTVVVHWNAAGTTGGRDLYTGPTFAWSAARGNLGLQLSSHAATAADMLGYVQWGAAGQPRSDLAEAAGLWKAASFLPAAAEGHALALAPGAPGHSPQDWSDIVESTPDAAPPGLAGAWGGWSMLAGRGFVAPALTYDVDRDLLDLAAVDGNGAPVHYRFRDGAWSAGLALTAKTSLPAALATSADGTVEMAVVGSDQLVYHNRLINGTWSGFVSTGQRTAQPPALAANFWARALELVIVGLDGQLLHNRFSNGQWGAWSPVGASAGGPPVLGVSTQDSAFDLIFAAVDAFLFRGHFTTGWGSPEALAKQTRLRPAVAAGIGGNLDVAITATDGKVYHNRYLAGNWRGWVAVGQQSDLPPALVSNVDANTLELAVVARDQRLTHARYLNGHWTAWLPLGAVSAAAPALVQGAGDHLEMVIAGADHSLWHNRFQQDRPTLVSFQNDIVPLLTNRCAVCHEGSDAPEGLILDSDHAYEATVNTPSSEQKQHMFRIAPLNPDASYLFAKVSGTQLQAGGSGDRMPQGGQLSPDEITLLRNWILQGALNN